MTTTVAENNHDNSNNSSHSNRSDSARPPKPIIGNMNMSIEMVQAAKKVAMGKNAPPLTSAPLPTSAPPPIIAPLRAVDPVNRQRTVNNGLNGPFTQPIVEKINVVEQQCRIVGAQSMLGNGNNHVQAVAPAPAPAPAPTPAPASDPAPAPVRELSIQQRFTRPPFHLNTRDSVRAPSSIEEQARKELQKLLPILINQNNLAVAKVHEFGANSVYILQVTDPETSMVHTFPFRDAQAMNKVKELFATPEIERQTRPSSWVVDNTTENVPVSFDILTMLVRDNADQLITQEAAAIAKKCVKPVSDTVYILQTKVFPVRLVFPDKASADAVIQDAYNQMQEVHPTNKASLKAVRAAAFRKEHVDKGSNVDQERDMIHSTDAVDVEGVISREIARAMKTLSQPGSAGLAITTLRSARRLPADEDEDDDFQEADSEHGRARDRA